MERSGVGRKKPAGMGTLAELNNVSPKSEVPISASKRWNGGSKETRCQTKVFLNCCFLHLNNLPHFHLTPSSLPSSVPETSVIVGCCVRARPLLPQTLKFESSRASTKRRGHLYKCASRQRLLSSYCEFAYTPAEVITKHSSPQFLLQHPESSPILTLQCNRARDNGATETSIATADDEQRAVRPRQQHRYSWQNVVQRRSNRR